MFLCVSLNPAVDKRLTMRALEVGKVNRACKAEGAPGGKAAHVAMVLKTLGAEPRWLGFAGGATGTAVVEGLREMGIGVETVAIAGETRTNLEIIEDEERVTEILEPGPLVSREELGQFGERLERILAKSGENATVAFSGSLPAGAPSDTYATLIGVARKYRSRVLLDTSGEALKAGLAAGPDFVKPNQEEAEWLSGERIEDARSAGVVLKKILRAGAGAAAISLGADGLVWQSGKEQQALFARIPRQASRFCVGSGDATLAGFAFAAQQGLLPVEALRLAAACGVANCLADGPGRARAGDIARLKDEISVETLA